MAVFELVIVVAARSDWIGVEAVYAAPDRVVAVHVVGATALCRDSHALHVSEAHAGEPVAIGLRVPLVPWPRDELASDFSGVRLDPVAVVAKAVLLDQIVMRIDRAAGIDKRDASLVISEIIADNVCAP